MSNDRHNGKWAICGGFDSWWHYGQVKEENNLNFSLISNYGKLEFWDKNSSLAHIIYVDTEKEADDIFERDDMRADYERYQDSEKSS